VNAKPIPEKGVGFKVFHIDKGRLTQFNYSGKPYKKKRLGWIRWDDSLARGDEFGFVFFLREEEVDLFIKYWKTQWGEPSNLKKKRIEYKGGMTTAYDSYFSHTDCAYCKSFRILD
jgi:hypothetical protein